MKTAILLTFLSAGILAAQSPPKESKPSDVSDPAAGIAEVRASKRPSVSRIIENKPVSGALVQAVRVGNPLKLIDPRAPREMGNGYTNVSVDPVTGKAQGIKLFVLNF